ncbi:MAG: hypothetical protein JGK34_26700, partial [Microcoleus sp. PH2017_26_ELK_O_A]|nr:hypothetical protein [Microcoleus sp. PH2017_26_ELK_O_A]
AEVRGFNPVFAIFDSSNRQVGFSQYPYFTFLPAASGYYKVIVMSKDPSTVPNRYSLRATAVPAAGPPQPLSLPTSDGFGSGVAGFESAPMLGETPFFPATNSSSNFNWDGFFLGTSDRSTVSTDGGNFFNSPGGFERPASQPQNSSNNARISPPATGRSCRTYPAGTVMFGSAVAARYYTYCLMPAAVFPTATPSTSAPSFTVPSPQPANNSLPVSPANPASLPAGVGSGGVESGGTAPANPGNFRQPSESEFYPY